jgi:hypothetical protein
MKPRALLAFVLPVLLAACGDAGGTGGTSSTGAGGAGGHTTGSTGGGGGTGGGGASGSAFSYGLNLGYYNPQLTDVESSQLGLAAGARSHRHKLTEPFLDAWGDDIHVAELTAMTQAGERDLVCFLVGASEGHSNAPPGSSDYERELRSPKNLYEPIFTAGGDVNPDNTWASFVARAVTTYKPFIHTWEVWNEPDQVGGNWQAAETWDTEPPKASDLVWWQDSIFAYIRMLRVTHEVVHKLDPEGRVALGGIGYPSFLAALLRYTDEPTAGAVDADHPAKGGAYFDVVSYHYYPVFAPGSSDVGARGLVKARDDLQAKLDAASVTGKRFIVTESGAPRFALGGAPGGVDYAHNYLLKAMALAQNAGIGRIDWFILGDGKPEGASSDPFSYMGLYLDLSSVADPSGAQITESGIAYATMGGLLDRATSDPEATAALGLAAGTAGVALRTADGKRAYVVWAETASDESGAGTVALPATGDVSVHAWDDSKTHAAQTIAASGGKVTVAVSSAPVIVIAP